MPDAVGYRAKWGVIIPSTSTVVEHDFALLCPYGVTAHAGRAYISRPSLASDRAAMDVLDQMDASFESALRDVMTVEPDHIVVAMSAEVIRRGSSGVAEFIDVLEQRTQLPVTTGPTAVIEALRVMGANRIGVLTPYQPISDTMVCDYFAAEGVEVGNVRGLRCESATAIAKVTPDQLAAALREVDRPDLDAIVQVGTNLSMVRVAAQAETWLGKPTIAMNTATVWHALRRSKFDDRFADYGSLLRDY